MAASWLLNSCYFTRLVGKETSYTLDLLVDFVFKFAAGPEDVAVAILEVGLLGAAHLADQIKELSTVHRSIVS